MVYALWCVIQSCPLLFKFKKIVRHAQRRMQNGTYNAVWECTQMSDKTDVHYTDMHTRIEFKLNSPFRAFTVQCKMHQKPKLFSECSLFFKHMHIARMCKYTVQM